MRIGNSDGSFLDKASDLINAGLHVVDRAMKNVSAGFSNIGNSIAGGVSYFVGNLAHACYKIVVITSGSCLSERVFTEIT